MTTPRPAGITVDRTERVMTITWQDGHVSRYPFAGLRAVCPCVECKGGHAYMGGPPDPALVRDTPDSGIQLEQVERVGSYALQFLWSDGHGAGIYHWELLRQACPCPICLPVDVH